ncbi:MAG: peptidoglycan DD-metalloendopeptidase family protein [Neisseria sp.]|nr:peptidoglycan DD-metalloendopeptidase family protein [Neisseria sp.]
MGRLNGFCLMVLLAANVAHAAPEASSKDLNKVRQAIEETGREVRTKKAEQGKIAAEVRTIDKKLQQQRTELDKILREKKQAVQALTRLQQNAAALQTQIDGTRAQVARLLNAQYRNRRPETVILMLQNADPNDKGRQLQYMRYLQAANRGALDNLALQQQELARQSEEIAVQIERVQQLLTRQQKIVRDLSRQKDVQLSAMDKLGDDITRNEKRIKTLKNDEARLSALLQRLAAEKARKRAAERQAAAKKAAAARALAAQQAESGAAVVSELAVIADETPPRSAFSRLQGQLRLPLSGSLYGRFGAAKPEGGAWNGVYIATESQSVQAVAAGDVAYAGDLRGYGNTVIVDHDGAYLTVYAGLSTLAVARGNQVNARQSLGMSGALPGERSGLYFEIRYHTRALNPMSWVK